MRSRWLPARSVIGARLQLDAQPVGDAIRVGVVRGDLGDVEDVAVAETRCAQGVGVGALDRCGTRRQLFGVRENRRAALVEPGRPPVDFDPREQVVVPQQPAQTAPVVRDSIVAAVELADDEGDELAVDLAQAGGAGHDRAVQLEVRREPGRVQRVDLHDVVDSAAARIDDLRVQPRELAARRALVDVLDPGQSGLPAEVVAAEELAVEHERGDQGGQPGAEHATECSRPARSDPLPSERHRGGVRERRVLQVRVDRDRLEPDAGQQDTNL